MCIISSDNFNIALIDVDNYNKQKLNKVKE